RAARAFGGRRESRSARARACAPPPGRARSDGRARRRPRALAQARLDQAGAPVSSPQRPRPPARRRFAGGVPRGGHVLPGSLLMGRYVLAIDQGTTGSTALILDQKLSVKAKANVEFRQIFPRPGWVEHDLDDISTATLKAIGTALRQAAAKPGD